MIQGEGGYIPIALGQGDNTPPTWMSEIANTYPALREYLERVQADVGVFGKEP